MKRRELSSSFVISNLKKTLGHYGLFQNNSALQRSSCLFFSKVIYHWCSIRIGFSDVGLYYTKHMAYYIRFGHVISTTRI